ncbi:MAG: hypothetical protein M1376_05980 [Planctomycetes bacterium]|nr:hypothetical protein [Planctomycetota bacterium]
MNVLLAHYRHVFDEQTLMKWTSPHFSPKEAGEALRDTVLRSLHGPISQTNLVFNRSHIICANEVFPESAVADSVADLEIWDEWRNGRRAFPYPGKYSRLGITIQEGKVSSKTSVGMIGEILAGLVSQSYLGPWVLVRVISRWPDFIYYTRDGRYAFVESKAFGAFDRDPSDPEKIPPRTLGECFLEAARQLNTDPFVKVWLCFTGISRIDPFHATTSLFELDAPNRRRETVVERVVPQPVISGLAHRAIVHAASEMEEADEFGMASLSELSQGRKSESRRMAERQLAYLAIERIEEELLLSAAPRDLLVPIRQQVEEEIRNQAGKVYMPEAGVARRFERAKRVAAEGRLAQIRPVGAQWLYLADLPVETRHQMERTWAPDWGQVDKPWGRIGDMELWRGSSAVLALGGPELEGQNIATASRE